MKIKSLRLVNYRNYDILDLTLNENITVLYGDNGQGKTNILESIYLISTAKSYRTTKDNDLIRFGFQYFDVFLKLFKNDYDYEVHFHRDTLNKKQISINEIPIRKLGELIGLLKSVIFAPEDLTIIKDGPSNRRRFMDITISQINPSYFYNLQQYNKVLKNRNILLKEIAAGKKNDTIDVWNQSMIQIGTKIVLERMKFINRISDFVLQRHFMISDSKEQLSLTYKNQLKIEDGMSESEIEENFSNLLKNNYKSDIFNQSTMVGPHRDDITIKLNHSDIRHFGSQGQQRSAILSLKLSEVDFMNYYSDEKPVLLLDDVFSELDEKRRDTLLKSTQSIQTIITCTDKSIVKGRDVSFYEVVNGAIK